MRFVNQVLCTLAIVIALTSCTRTPVQDVKRMFQDNGESQLRDGIRQYKDGRYSLATTSLQTAIAKGLSNPDELTANRYLAFASCASNRERQCRAYFRRALELDPSFELEPADARNPVLGKVFGEVKTERER